MIFRLSVSLVKGIIKPKQTASSPERKTSKTAQDIIPQVNDTVSNDNSACPEKYERNATLMFGQIDNCSPVYAFVFVVLNLNNNRNSVNRLFVCVKHVYLNTADGEYIVG